MKSNNDNNLNSNCNNNLSNDLDYLVEVIKRSGIDIAPTYDEYTDLAFAIATDYGEAGRWAFHEICSLSGKYNDKHADKLYTDAMASNRGVKHIASAFYLAKQAGVNIDEVRLKRAEDRQREREEQEKEKRKMGARVHGCKGTTPTHACVHYNASANSSAHQVQSGTNIDYDDESFANMPDNGEEPVSEKSEPFSPLPLLFDEYHWPKPIAEILAFAETRHQRDALFLGMVDAIGSTLAPYVRIMYGGRWMYPNIQLFVVAPPASGKGVVSWCRNFVEPLHERIRNDYKKDCDKYQKEKLQWEQMGKSKADAVEPQMPLNKMFLISGDNSSTGIAQNVIESDGRGIIIETEADTVSAALGTDYGLWSHMLRNFFDHSRISYNRRLNREYMEISRTMVSVILAGTPAQVPPLIPSSENGLFSRMLFYYMPGIGEWRRQFRENRMDITAKMASHGRRWMETRDEISKLGSVTLIFSDEQKTQFDNCFRALFERCLKANENAMTASLARMAVNIVRIMSIIAVLRRIEQCGVSFEPAADISGENKKDGIIAACEVNISDEDFCACLAMAEPLYLHATHILSFIERNEVKNKNVSDRERLFELMGNDFSRSQWMDAAESMRVPYNTAKSWLQRLLKSGVVVKSEERGIYIKSSAI